jgi:hypothetical protein
MNGLQQRLREISRKGRWLGAIVTALVLGSGSLAVALAIPSADGRIFGCYSAKDGALRVVEEGTACGKNEISIFWNQTGPVGPKGETGPQGPTGPTGPAGGGGIASLNALNALPCNTPTGEAGTTRLVVADGNVSLFCDVPRPVGNTVRPVFASVAVSANVVTVTFSEPVCRAAPFNPPDWTVISNGSPVVSTPVVAEGVPVCNAASDNGVATANLLLANAMPNGAFVGVTLNPSFFGSLSGGFSDRDGNLIRAPQTRTATVTAPETIRPTLASATTTVGSTTLTLTFSEPVWCSFSLLYNETDFTISDNDPATVDPMVTGPGTDFCGFSQIGADLSFSIITNAPFLAGRSYAVTLTPEANEIQDVVGNDLLDLTSHAIDVN